jgi:hypothetical protein
VLGTSFFILEKRKAEKEGERRRVHEAWNRLSYSER